MILIIDNYDSFVYNLVQEFRLLDDDVRVVRRGALRPQDTRDPQPDMIVISPGPGRPEDAPECIEIIRRCHGTVPILGVCLGHQCIGAAFGGRVSGARRLMHGRSSEIYHDGRSIFHDMANPFSAIRYHSLVVQEEELPGDLEVSAFTADGEIMGLRARGGHTEGLQFHPESFLTRDGRKLLRNFHETARKR